MNYSKAHQKFSDYLQKPEALTNPQDFLGPNYCAVINFWWYLDSLTKDQWEEVARHYDAAWDAARDAVRDVVRDAVRSAARGAAWYAARDAAWDAAWYAAGYATYELIGMHTLLEQGRELIFVPMFDFNNATL